MSFLRNISRYGSPLSSLLYGQPVCYFGPSLAAQRRMIYASTSCILPVNALPSSQVIFCPTRASCLGVTYPSHSVRRSLSTDVDEHGNQMDEKKMSLIQRFKASYAIHGKVFIVIHGITSCLWFGSAYLVAKSGINMLELFEAAHFPEWACKPLRVGGGTVNTLATTLILYKIVAPLRYGLTLVLARYTIQYLRAKGKAPQMADRNRLRNLARESAQLSRERFKHRIAKGRKAAVAFSKKAMTVKHRR